jgi:uncharacterized iron-regulated membrane protein
MTAIETVGLAFGFAILVLGFIGAIVFPIRYYRRRRSPYRVLAMLSLSNVVLGLGVAVGLVLARDYLNEGDEELEQLTVGEDIAISLFLGLFTFLVLSVFAFVLFWLLSKSRAARELRSNTETL